MGGEIGVISELGKGSEFYFTLTFPKVKTTEYSSPEMCHIEALIADDSDISLNALSGIALGLGWNVSTADCSKAVMLDLEKRSASALPNVVILDWKMPGIDGLETARLIRKNYRDEDCPIVIMATAFALSGLTGAAGFEMIDAVLSKPVTASNLYNAVMQAQRRRGDGQQMTGALERPKIQSLKNIKLLIVDDSEINREVAKRIFHAQGAYVVTQENGKQAVDWLLANPYDVDLVIMDVQMPIMDGLEAATILRTHPQFDDLPIIAMTAGAFKSQQEAACAAGMNHFVSKPFDVPTTIALIQNVRRNPRSTDPHLRATPAQLAVDDIEGTKNSKRAVLDVAKGMTLWENVRPYREYLGHFVLNHVNVVDQINSLLADSDRSAAAALAHKLSGSAGALALTGTQQLASEAERILEMGYDPTLILLELQSELLLASEAIHRFAEGVEGVYSSPTRMSQDDIRSNAQSEIETKLRELLQALDKDNPTPFETIVLTLNALLPKDHLEAVHSCVRDFDFHGAKIEVFNLAIRYGINLDNQP